MAIKLSKYKAPVWAQSLKRIPEFKIQLAAPGFTPITEWKLPDFPQSFKVLLKRDDYTGSILSGNKVRKLEFILAEAIAKGCKHVISVGALQSNHCRAVAASCAELGLQSHLFLRTPAKDDSQLKYDGNFFLNRLLGSHLYMLPMGVKYKAYVEPRMKALAENIERETGESSHLVCVGGSDNTGIWGYIQCFAELRQQAVEFDDIVCVCGSGGTVSGLAIANYLCGMPYRCHGILVCDSNQYFHEEVNGNLEALGVKDVRSEDIVHLHDAYKEPGYGRNLPCHFEFISQSAVQTGVILDNTYTGKAAYGLRDLMQNKPGVFKGRRILFIHSGGQFSLLTEEMASHLLPFSTKSKVTFLPK